MSLFQSQPMQAVLVALALALVAAIGMRVQRQAAFAERLRLEEEVGENPYSVPKLEIRSRV